MNENAALRVGRSGVHHYTSADSTDRAAADDCGNAGVAENFLAGVHNTSQSSLNVKQGVWGEGFCKSG